MRLVDLFALYFVVGIAAGVAIYARAAVRDGRAVASAVLAVPLWPLWAPIALTAHRAPPPFMLEGVPRQIEAALAEALDAVEGSPLENLLSKGAVTNILGEVERAAARCAELDALLARPELDPDLAAQRLTALESEGAAPRTLASARLHHENVRRLVNLRARDRQALEELTDLVAALRTQLVLARYAGSSAEGVGGIVTEMWARVEGLGAAIELDDMGECAVAEANPGS
jgi:hypothetical protein